MEKIFIKIKAQQGWKVADCQSHASAKQSIDVNVKGGSRRLWENERRGHHTSTIVVAWKKKPPKHLRFSKKTLYQRILSNMRTANLMLLTTLRTYKLLMLKVCAKKGARHTRNPCTQGKWRKYRDQRRAKDQEVVFLRANQFLEKAKSHCHEAHDMVWSQQLAIFIVISPGNQLLQQILLLSPLMIEHIQEWINILHHSPISGHII